MSERDKESRLRSDERSSPLSNENCSSNSGARVTEAGKSAKEVASVFPSLRNSDCTAGLSVIISREDLYYDEADRAELASWAEFPREAELSRRHELVVRARRREELRQGQSPSSGVSSGRGRSRSWLSRRVGNFSGGEETERVENNSKKVTSSARGKRRSRRILMSGDDGGDPDHEADASERSEPESSSALSSRAVLGQRGRSATGEKMAPFLRSRLRKGSGGVVGVRARDLSSDEEGSTMTLLASEDILRSTRRGRSEEVVNGASRLQSLSGHQADLRAGLAQLQAQQEEEERRAKEEEERRKKDEEERVRRQQEEEEERRAKERQEKEQEDGRRSSLASSSSPRRRSNVRGVAAQSQIAVSIRPLHPSAAIVSIAARRGVLESAWLPLRGAIRPTVGDEVVLGHGRSAMESAIQPMHMEFFLPR